jgi:hypothetical protein
MMPEAPEPVDRANTLLEPCSAHLLTGMNGTLGLITIRTPTTTLTVQLPKADILAWGLMIMELGDSMPEGSSLLVATPASAVTLLRP